MLCRGAGRSSQLLPSVAVWQRRGPPQRHSLRGAAAAPVRAARGTTTVSSGDGGSGSTVLANIDAWLREREWLMDAPWPQVGGGGSWWSVHVGHGVYGYGWCVCVCPERAPLSPPHASGLPPQHTSTCTFTGFAMQLQQLQLDAADYDHIAPSSSGSGSSRSSGSGSGSNGSSLPPHQRRRTLMLVRDDMLHPLLGGNKLRKLDGLLPEALAGGAQHLVRAASLAPLTPYFLDGRVPNFGCSIPGP